MTEYMVLHEIPLRGEHALSIENEPRSRHYCRRCTKLRWKDDTTLAILTPAPQSLIMSVSQTSLVAMNPESGAEHALLLIIRLQGRCRTEVMLGS